MVSLPNHDKADSDFREKPIMKKLALIVRSAQSGGVENHVYEILKKADFFGYTPTLISLSEVTADDKFKKLGIEVILLKDKRTRSFHSLFNIYHLYRVLKKIKPDIVHCHGTRPIFIGTVAARIAGIRNILVTIHNSYKLMTYDNNANINYKLLIISKIIHAIGFSLSRYVIVVSKKLSEELEDAFRYFPFLWKNFSSKIRIVHNGIDIDKFRNSITKDKNNNLKVIGTVGRLDPMKGVKNLLLATKELLDNGYAFEVLIVGDGRYRNELLKLSETLGINKRVYFLGYKEEPAEFYNMMDIFVLPSLSEGFGLVNLEAMASGIPVITTDVGCASEAVINLANGIIVPPGDVTSLSNAMRFLLDNDDIRLRMGAEGRKTVESRFTDKIMLNKIFALYDETFIP